MGVVEWLIPWRKSGLARWIYWSAAIGVLSICLIWLWLVNSAPYEIASAHITQSKEIEAIVGMPVSFSVKSFRINRERANFIFHVSGPVASRNVIITLNKNENWHIDRVQF